jgi:hypothetical protein
VLSFVYCFNYYYYVETIIEHNTVDGLRERLTSIEDEGMNSSYFNGSANLSPIINQQQQHNMYEQDSGLSTMRTTYNDNGMNNNNHSAVDANTLITLIKQQKLIESVRKENVSCFIFCI